MEVIQNTKDKFVLRSEMSESLANAIRRSVSEVPTLAVEEVEIYKNDSALYDEVLAHRIGLVPLKTEKSMTSKSKVTMKLVKEGPCTVYSGDIKGDVEVIYDKIPLTILGDDQKLELAATATLGKAIDHAKYSPGLCFYRHIIEIKSSPEIDKIVNKGKSPLKAVKTGNKWICDLNESDVDEIVKTDKEAVKDTSEILFIVESYGNMPAKDIFLKAVEALEDNLDDFVKKIK